MSFGRGGRFSSEYDKPKEVKAGTVANIKESPEKGKKRLIVRDKTGMRSSYAVDIAHKDAKHVERKESYYFELEEKSDDRYGGGQGFKKSGRFKTYYCEDAPERYVSGGKGQNDFKDFSGTSRLNKGKGGKKVTKTTYSDS